MMRQHFKWIAYLEEELAIARDYLSGVKSSQLKQAAASYIGSYREIDMNRKALAACQSEKVVQFIYWNLSEKGTVFVWTVVQCLVVPHTMCTACFFGFSHPQIFLYVEMKATEVTLQRNVTSVAFNYG